MNVLGIFPRTQCNFVAIEKCAKFAVEGTPQFYMVSKFRNRRKVIIKTLILKKTNQKN